HADFYLFAAAANETIYIAGIGNFNCDTQLQIIHADRLASSGTTCAGGDIEFNATVPGDYYLVFDSGREPAQNYSFMAYRATATVTAVADRDATISGVISGPGDMKEYTFEAAAGERLYFDVLNGTAENLSFSLLLPDGSSWGGGYGANENGYVWQMPHSGTYRLRVDGAGRATGNFNLRLLDLSDSPVLPFDSLRLDTRPAAGEAKFVRFQAEAGQRLYFDAYDADYANCDGSWALYNTSSSQVFSFLSNGLCGDHEFVAPATGDYWLRFTAGGAGAGTAFHYRLTTPETTITPLQIGVAYGAGFAWSPPSSQVMNVGPLAFAPSGRLFGLLGLNSRIVELNPSTGAVIGQPINVEAAGYELQSLAVNSSGELFVGSPYQNSIGRFNADTGQYLGPFVANGAGGLTRVAAMKFGPDGNLYVATGNNSEKILRYSSDGNALGIFVDGAAVGLSQISSLAFTVDGTLLVSSNASGLVYRFAAGTGASLGTIGNPAQHGAARLNQIAVLSNGDLLLGSGDNRLIRLESDTWRYRGDVALKGSHYYYAETLANLAVDSSDNVLLPIYEYFGNSVRIFRYSSTPLAGCLDASVLCEPGTVREYRFQGVAGQRLLFDSLLDREAFYTSYESLVRFELYSPSNAVSASFNGGYDYYSSSFEPLLVLPQDGEYRLVVKSFSDRLGDFQFRLLNATSDASLSVDTPVTVAISGYENAVFQYQAIGGERLYVWDPTDVSHSGDGFARIMDASGKFITHGYLSTGFDWEVKAAGTYYLSVSHQNPLRQDSFQLAVGSRTPIVNPLPPLGQVVNVSVDRPGDRYEYTFQGTVGQRLLASLISPRDYTSGFDAISVITPSGVVVGGYGNGSGGELATYDLGYRSFEGAYFLPESGEYRIVVDPYAHYTLDYSFQIRDVSALPELPIGIPWKGSVTTAERDDSFRFEAVKGQEFNFTANDATYREGYLRILGPGNQLLAGRGLDENFQFTAPGPGVYVVSAISLITNRPITYDFTVTTSALRAGGSLDDTATNRLLGQLPGTAPLAASDLATAVIAAYDAWSAAGLGDRDWFACRFASITFQTADLPTGYLGLTVGDRVLIDIDGDGRGWRLPGGTVAAGGLAGNSADDARFDLL
ncbi:MAG: hypothetical protein ACKO38_04135, partial [Planctomycetota bacterium]